MEKTLIILTSGYPYGIYDDFLDNELKFLKTKFKKIHFIVPEHSSNLKLRELDFDYSIAKVKKISKISFLFSRPFSFIQSIQDLKYSNVKISVQSIKIAMDYQLNATSYQKTINNISIIEGNQCYFYSYWFDFRALALTYLKKEKPNNFYFSRAHGYDIYKERQPFHYQPFKKNLIELNKIYTISEVGKNYLSKFFNIPKTIIQTHRLGVFSENKLELETKEKPDILKIFSCSNMVTIKRIHLIIESLSLFEKTKKVKWVHIGDGLLKNDLENLASKKLKDNIQFSFLGEIKNSEVREFYIKFKPDLFINTSSTEGIPVSIMEAFSFGVPAIATDVGGTSEILTSDNGILLPSNPTPQDIKSAIEIAFSQPEKRIAAFQTWNEKYDAEKNYLSFVKELMSF